MNYVRYFSIFLGVSLLGSIIAPAHAATLPQLKNSFSRSVKDFIDCLKGDQSCDPKKIKAYRVAIALASAVILAATGAGIYYFTKKYPRKPSQPISPKQQKLNTDLFEFIKFHDINRVAQALKQGAHIEATDIYGFTPLMYASYEGNTDLVRFLIKKRAQINALNVNSGKTALMYAAHKGHPQIVQILLTSGANVHIKSQDKDLPTALALTKYMAQEHTDLSDYQEIISHLEQAGATE